MHVFIDTNILLNFFHHTKDELDSLHNVFASHEHGSATVHLTEQVCNEFLRNRENKIKDALKKFKETKFSPQIPSFMKEYEEYQEILNLSKNLRQLQSSILGKVDGNVSARNLAADSLIESIFSTTNVVELTTSIYEKAAMRTALGNPPGKSNSMGDSVNWTILLNHIPNDEDIHVISEDGDFYSTLDDQKAHPFLEDEWLKNKKGELFVYRTLSAFMVKHFDGIAFSFDKDKAALIDELFSLGCFAQTHVIIAKLENYNYFSTKEVVQILNAIDSNSQVGGIITDDDVSAFLHRVALPHKASLTSEAHQNTLAKILKEKNKRDDE